MSQSALFLMDPSKENQRSDQDVRLLLPFQISNLNYELELPALAEFYVMSKLSEKLLNLPGPS